MNVHYLFNNELLIDKYELYNKSHLNLKDKNNLTNILNGYKCYIYDSNINILDDINQINRIYSLCTLWDSNNGKINKNNTYIEFNNNLNNNLKIEETNFEINSNTDFYFFDNNNPINLKVCNLKYEQFLVYDEIYNMLNINSLESYNITFKLRLCKLSEDNYNIMLIIEHKNNNNIIKKYYFLKYGGFGVKILSYGLLYINKIITNKQNINIEKIKIEIKQKLNDELNEEKKKLNLNEDIDTYIYKFEILCKIIDDLKEILNNEIDNENKNKNGIIKNYLSIILLRFKSSKDHGTINTVNFLNKICNIKTLYVSGDSLSFIYSMILNIPTIFRYYEYLNDKIYGVFLPLLNDKEIFNYYKNNNINMYKYIINSKNLRTYTNNLNKLKDLNVDENTKSEELKKYITILTDENNMLLKKIKGIIIDKHKFNIHELIKNNINIINIIEKQKYNINIDINIKKFINNIKSINTDNNYIKYKNEILKYNEINKIIVNFKKKINEIDKNMRKEYLINMRKDIDEIIIQNFNILYQNIFIKTNEIKTDETNEIKTDETEETDKTNETKIDERDETEETKKTNKTKKIDYLKKFIIEEILNINKLH